MGNSSDIATGSWLLIGCGYVGTRVLARLRAQGATTAVVSRDAARAAAFANEYGARVLLGHYADGVALRVFCTELPAPLRVLCMLPPSACTDAQATLAPFEQLHAVLSAVRPARAVLTSSTGVYGAQNGAQVTAESACRPVTPRETMLLDIERAWLDGDARHVVRCAGLYGPGRVVGLPGLQQGKPVPGDPDGWLNLLHVEDAARLVIAVASTAAARVELGADGQPVTRRRYYGTLAAWAGVAPPVFDGAAPSRGGGARRCDPSTTWSRLGWRPMYSDFVAGLAALDRR